MEQDVTLLLQDLHCVRENEGGSEPYIWPVLLWTDDTSLMAEGDDLLQVRGPLLADARVVLKENMKAGETAPIPSPLGTLGVRFEEVSTFSYLLLVVAVFDHDETPQDAMWAGCKAFSSELRAAIVKRLPGLITAVTQGDGEELERLIDEIKAQVKDATKSATWNALTGWQKARLLAGTLNADDYIGAAFYFGRPVGADLSLVITSDDGSEEYRVDGSIAVRRTTVDLCQAKADAVKSAQDVVDGIESQRSVAQAELKDAPPGQKAAIVARITQLGHDLDNAMIVLDEARRELQKCREKWAATAEARRGGAVEGVTVVNPG
jgi:hypothetical protein